MSKRKMLQKKAEDQTEVKVKLKQQEQEEQQRKQNNMLKSLKIFLSIFVIFTVIGISSPIMAEDNVAVTEPVKTESTLPLKQPYSRKALAMKFIMAMIGVGASSVIIYVGLSVYNRFIYGTSKPKHVKTEDDNFKTPNNMKDALDIFLKKTK